ncbi:MAG: aromatic-ring-hydroxylating dioxygenase subunit beta [Acidimicrobiales bacterium]
MLDHHGVEQFLYREARLMDTHAYDAWLALWARTAHYWIPCNADDIDVSRHVSIVNEDRIGLEDRIRRLQSGAHYAQDPPSRLSRVVSNVELDRDGTSDALIVHSTFNLTAHRRGRIDVVAGRVVHHLVREDDAVRISVKKVVLVDNDDIIMNLTYLV